VVALDTPPPSRQYSRWLFFSLSLSLSTSSLVLHHITKPALVASRLLIASLRPPPPPPPPPPHFRHQSIHQSINHLGDSRIRCNMSLSLLNEGIVVSERERERERCHRHARNATLPYSVSAPAKGKSHKALPRGVAVSLSLSFPTHSTPPALLHLVYSGSRLAVLVTIP